MTPAAPTVQAIALIGAWKTYIYTVVRLKVEGKRQSNDMVDRVGVCGG